MKEFPASHRRIRASHCIGSTLLLLAILVGVGCTTVKTVGPYDGGPLPRPDVILVNDFAYSPSQVKLMRGISPDLERAIKGTPRTAQELAVGAKVARVLAEHLVKEIRDMGLPADLAVGEPTTLGNTYAIEGQFLSIDEGNRTERVVVGLGLGRTSVKTLVQLYRDTADGQRLVEQLDATGKSGRKPGMAMMMGVGGLAGNLAVSAAVSATLAAGSERFGATVEADAARMARDVAKKLKAFFVTQAWVSP